MRPALPSKVDRNRHSVECDRYDVLLIAAEVDGFGRTGRWFALEHFGVQADIMTAAKDISGLYVPMGLSGGVRSESVIEAPVSGRPLG